VHFIAVGGFSFTIKDGFVKKMTYTPSNVHDSKEFDKLLGINKHKNKIKTCSEVYADHFIAVGGFSFTISSYFDIIVGFRILSVIAIPTLAFA
jgi:hypothetical protein